jgi:hypothetical protein
MFRDCGRQTEVVASNLERATSREVEIADKQKDAWHDTKKGKNDHCSSH